MALTGQARDELDALRRFSARIGGNPLLAQAAGGNSSLKVNGTLWIKASGTWLMNALRDDIFVPVAIAPLLAAVRDQSPRAEQAQEFVLTDLNPSGLRPSIETTVHALMPQRIVVHVHCVDTIASAVDLDAGTRLAERLAGVNWDFIPYSRPGLPLAMAIAARRRPETDVLVLGNHGLVVAAETVAGAEALLARISGLLARRARPAPAPDLPALGTLAGDAYRLPAFPEAHGAATDAVNCRFACGGSLYPDHVIFLGAGSEVARPGESAADVVARRSGDAPAAILFPGKGVLLRADATDGAEALARCLGDVTARVTENARLRYLTEADGGALLNWDAEKYRQALNRRRRAPAP